MPVIDLKNTEIFFEDGTLLTGAINNLKTGAVNFMAGYAPGATSLVVDGFTGIIPVGSRITAGANSVRVLSTVETSGNTTTVVLASPGLTEAVVDDAVLTVNGFAVGASILVVDGFVGAIPDGARITVGGREYIVSAATETSGNTTLVTVSPVLTAVAADNSAVTANGVFLRIKVGDGTITWSEKKPREYKKDRGRLDQVRNADEEPIDVNLNLMYEELTASSGAPPTPEDVLKQRGAAEDWVSAETDDACAPFAINIRLDHTPPNCTSVQTERVILPRFRYEQLDHNPKDGTISCQGKCNATEAIVTRFDQPA